MRGLKYIIRLSDIIHVMQPQYLFMSVDLCNGFPSMYRHSNSKLKLCFILALMLQLFSRCKWPCHLLRHQDTCIIEQLAPICPQHSGTTPTVVVVSLSAGMKRLSEVGYRSIASTQNPDGFAQLFQTMPHI